MLHDLNVIDQRRAPRFDLHVPITVRWKDGSGMREAPTISRDVSSKGVYFPLADSISLEGGTAVELEMTLPNEITLAEPVRVRCLGHLQRCELSGVAVVIDKYEFRPDKSVLNHKPATKR